MRYRVQRGLNLIAGSTPARSRRYTVSIEQFQRAASGTREMQMSELTKVVIHVRWRVLWTQLIWWAGNN